MTILITGGAHLSGVNVVRQWISCRNEAVVNPGCIIFAKCREGRFGPDVALNKLGRAVQSV